MDAGILEKCGMEPSQWASKAFPVIKGNGKDVCIVSDFEQLNKAIEQPHWPTESSDQLLRNIESDSRFFVTLDLTSGYPLRAGDTDTQLWLKEYAQPVICLTTLQTEI